MKTWIAVLLLAFPSIVLADPPEGPKEFKAVLTALEEVPAISSTGAGELQLRIAADQSSIDYELKYSGLEGVAQQAHLHLGQPAVNGGVAVYLCTNVGGGPLGTQACPTTLPATVTGTIHAADVVGPVPQGIEAGEFAELLRAIRSGAVYANVHTDKFPGGEIRGQVGVGKGRGRPIK